MLIVMKPNSTPQQIENVINHLANRLCTQGGLMNGAVWDTGSRKE